MVLPFHEELIPAIKILKHLNINLIFTYENTIRNSLIKNSPSNKTGGVYHVPCKKCDQIYIGHSGKHLEQRIKQHKYSVRTATSSSAIFKHVESFNHPINWEQACVVYPCSSVTERLIVESSLIKTCNSMNLNDGVYKFDNILISSLLKYGNIRNCIRKSGLTLTLPSS